MQPLHVTALDNFYPCRRSYAGEVWYDLPSAEAVVQSPNESVLCCRPQKAMQSPRDLHSCPSKELNLYPSNEPDSPPPEDPESPPSEEPLGDLDSQLPALACGSRSPFPLLSLRFRVLIEIECC